MIKKLYYLFIGLSLYSCREPHKITKNDLVIKCVIVSVEVKKNISTLEPYSKYYYTTDCGEKIITDQNDVYHIGDTIKYIYVDKLKNK